MFTEEAKDPRRTVAVSTYLSVGIIGVLYAVSAWVLTVAAGPDQIVGLSRAQGPETMFVLSGPHVGSLVNDIGHVLLLTSMIAAMISFHNTTARYAFALGRERVLPAVFGRTSRRTGAPKVGSIAQSVTALLVIVGYAVAGLNPLEQLFFWLGTGGAFGVLLLIAATAVSIVSFFLRNRTPDSMWHRLIAPGLAAVALLVIIAVAVANFGALLGTPDSPAAWLIPAVYPVAAVLGVAWAIVLRSSRPGVYQTIGLGANSATGRTTTSSPARPSATEVSV
nr:APC family permease [Longispora albida]